ncbi:MAG: porin [Dysgonomonas sp.]|nr:porin [Dysgonomonas sp.]
MKKILLIFLTIGLSTGLTYSQNSDELVKKLVEKNILTQSEAEDILKETTIKEQKSSTTQKLGKVRDAFNTPYMKFGGNGQMMYQYSDVNNIKHDFKPKNLFISVNGKLNDSFRYGFLIELVNPSVQEFWGEWTADQAFNLKLGQFKVPISLESQYVPATLETVSYSRTIANLIGYAGSDDVLKKQNGKNNFGRDAGVQIGGELINMGDHNLLQYAMGMFQGMGVSTGEVNNTKDFAGTIMLQPVKGFRIGGGAYFGEATYQTTITDPVVDHVRNRWVVSTDYQSDRFNARAEWIHANDGGIKKEGLYGLAYYYFIPKKLNLLAKVDYYNKNKDVNSEVMDYTFGLNYYFYPQCRVQFNYTYSDYSNRWGAENSNVIAAQLQLAF